MSAFLQGFSGGMNAIGGIINTRENRAIQREQMDLNRQNMEFNQQQQEQTNQRKQEIWDTEKSNLDKQDSLNKVYGMMTFRGRLSPEEQKTLDTGLINRVNEMPEVQQMLARDVEPGTRKQISQSGAKFLDGKVIPLVDVVNEETGEVLRTRPLTEYGRNDGSDKPLSLTYEDFAGVAASLNLGDMGMQMERDIMAQGGAVPSAGASDDHKVDAWNDEEGNRFRTAIINGRQVTFKNDIQLQSVEELDWGGVPDPDNPNPSEPPTDPDNPNPTEPPPKPTPAEVQSTDDINRMVDESLAELAQLGPGMKQIGNVAESLWDKTKRGVENFKNMAGTKRSYSIRFRGNGKHLKDDELASRAVEIFTEKNNGIVPTREQANKLFRQLKMANPDQSGEAGETYSPDPNDATRGELGKITNKDGSVSTEYSITDTENILIDAMQALEQGGEEALREYMSQYDDQTHMQVHKELAKQRGFEG